jgi:hypothetical protein
MGVASPNVSEGFCHPFPALIELDVEVKVGAGSVGIVPVWV